MLVAQKTLATWVRHVYPGRRQIGSTPGQDAVHARKQTFPVRITSELLTSAGRSREFNSETTPCVHVGGGSGASLWSRPWQAAARRKRRETTRRASKPSPIRLTGTSPRAGRRRAFRPRPA